jgi:hypothetical protein
MPAIIALLLRGLTWLVATYAGQWVLKILITLGITATTTAFALPALLSYVKQYAGAMGSDLYQAFGAIGGDVVVTMILSAMVAARTGKMIFRAVQR